MDGPAGTRPNIVPDPVNRKIEPKVWADLKTNGKATFFVLLKEQADARAAQGISDWKARGEYVVNMLKSVATRTQKPLIDTLVKKADAEIQAFWVTNIIQVTTGDPRLIQELAARTDVAALAADEPAEIPEPMVEGEDPTPQAIPWNVHQVRADDVWTQFNVRGEGIVVANIDTGVQYDHPALATKYRGRNKDGSYDHNYNWFNPAGGCPDPSTPCGNPAHGTPTMGSMVGDDGDVNQIGVAPDARWIAAKGCAGASCPTAALLRSGQWMLAPTDSNGENPRPEMRPHIINNSWGGGTGTFYQAMVQNWRNAGIFPVFASGNPGSACGRASAPAIYPESLAVGATSQTENIASFSGRGPAPPAFGSIIKPDVAAPGSGVRSSVTGSRYGNMSGTSMAAPHAVGVIALLWSANRDLVGDVDTTFDVIQSSARFRSSAQCGSEGPPDNVYGWGIIDALAAVQQVTLTESNQSN